MKVWIVLCIVFVLLCMFFIVRLALIKHELSRLAEELADTRKKNYDSMLRISLVDKDLEKLTGSMNENLVYQKKLKMESERREQAIRQNISDVAHDLRTPITVMKGNLWMLEQEASLSEHSKAYVTVCSQKADLLKQMVDDFFDLSVLESEQIVASMERLDLTKHLVEFVLEQEAVIRGTKLSLDFQVPEHGIFVQADFSMVNRMLGNLLNNVLKYAKGSFKIALLEDEETNCCRVVFENEIEPKESFDITHLFDRTYRGDKARTGNGAGLGLYIVKLLADKQKIRVYAEQEANSLRMVMEFQMTE